MSKDVSQEGQAGQMGQTSVRESIKYRRRAQDAERRCEVLETELEQLQHAASSEGQSLQETLNEAHQRINGLENTLGELRRERDLERALIKAGVSDVETASAVARQRLEAASEAPEDLDEFARALLEEKPHLKAEPKAAFSPLGTSTRSAKAPGNSRTTVLKNMAENARRTGKTQDILSYMRLRRAATRSDGL